MKKLSSFQQIERSSYNLMGFIPYLLAIYLIVHLEVEISPMILLVAAAALIAHLIGFTMIRRFRQQLQDVCDKVGMVMTAKHKSSIELNENVPDELMSIVQHFNALIARSEASSRNFQETTNKLMLYTRDIEGYQKKLRDESMSRYQLGRYVGQDVVDQISASSGDMPLENKKQRVTMLFSDIRSFTSISEHMAPEEVISMLNEYFDAMVNIIFKHDGILDKFVGDELMATFGALDKPGSAGQGPLNAVKAAIAMQDRMKKLMSDFMFKGYPVFETGIGINTGEVVMGNLGSKNRMDYTVIGDTVNVAARLEQMAKGNTIMVGEETYESCKAYVQMEPKGEIKVKNRAAPVKCFEVAK